MEVTRRPALRRLMERSSSPGRSPSGWPILVVVGLLLAVFAIATTSGPLVTGVRVPMSEGASEPTPAPPVDKLEPVPAPTLPSSESDGREPPAALRWLVGGLLAVAAGVVAWAVIRLLLRIRFVRRGGRVAGGEDADVDADPAVAAGPGGSPSVEEMREVVEAGLRELIDDGDPRRAVIGCWLRLEDAATGVGTDRRPEDTAADLVERLLAEHTVRVDALTRLADLYRRARFGPDRVDETMREEARTVLESVRTDLDRVSA